MESIPFAQKVDTWLKSVCGSSLIDFCSKFNYNPINIKILGLDEKDAHGTKVKISKDKDLRMLYLNCEKNPILKKCKGENRCWTRYFQDLITGWIMEDLTIEMLRSQGIEVSNNGRDANRIISASNIGQDPDITIKVGDVVRKVELTNEFNTFLSERGYIEKRSPALCKLWDSKSIWLYREIVVGKYVLIDFATEKIKIHHRHHEYWDKDVHRYILSENNKRIRDDRLLAAEIISVVGCGIEDTEQPKLEIIEDANAKLPLSENTKPKKKGISQPNPIVNTQQLQENPRNPFLDRG